MTAAGAGWAWLRDGDRVVHLTGADGPRGPVTAVTARVPVLTPGSSVHLDAAAAAVWRTPPPPPAAATAAVHAACAIVAPHRWNDPRALELGTGADPAGPIEDLIGRGPGLTPAGDDAIAGYAYAQGAVGAPGLARTREAVTDCLQRTAEPSRALLRAALDGEVFAPAATMLAALLAADGPALAPSVRALAALGSTTGRALLTGMTQALLAGG